MSRFTGERYLRPDDFVSLASSVGETTSVRQLWIYWEDGLLVPLALVQRPEAYARWRETVMKPTRWHWLPERAVHHRFRRLLEREERAFAPAPLRSATRAPHAWHAVDAEMRRGTGLIRPCGPRHRCPASAIRTVGFKRRTDEDWFSGEATRLVPLYGHWQVHELHAIHAWYYESVYAPRGPGVRSERGRIIGANRTRLLRPGESEPGDLLGLRHELHALADWRLCLRIANTVLLTHGQEELSGGLVKRNPESQERFRHHLSIHGQRLARAGLNADRCVSVAQQLVEMRDTVAEHGPRRLAEHLVTDVARVVDLLTLGHGLSRQEADDAIGAVGGHFTPATVRLFGSERHRVRVQHEYLFRFLAADGESAGDATIAEFLSFLEQHDLLGLASEFVDLNDHWHEVSERGFDLVERSAGKAVLLAEDVLRTWAGNQVELGPKDKPNTIARKLGKKLGWDYNEVKAMGKRGQALFNTPRSGATADTARQLAAILRAESRSDGPPVHVMAAFLTARNHLMHHRLPPRDDHSRLFCRDAANTALRLVWRLWRIGPEHFKPLKREDGDPPDEAQEDNRQ